MEQRLTEYEDSEQLGQTSKVSIPPHCPKEVILCSSHVLMGISLMGQETMTQLEVKLMLTGLSEMFAGSVTVPEKVFPIEKKFTYALATPIAYSFG